MHRLIIGTRRYVVRLTAFVVLGLALVIVAGAGLSAASGSSISLAPKAYVYDLGTHLETQVTVTCTDPSVGAVTMSVSQTAAQSSDGTGAKGNGHNTVRCDGSPHKLNVTVTAAGAGLFSIGQATAQAALIVGAVQQANDKRTIDIVHP